MSSDNLSILQILKLLQQGKLLGNKAWQILEAAELIDEKRALVFDITSANVKEVIKQRSLLFQSVIIDANKLPLADNNNFQTLWHLWLPLAMKLAKECQQLNLPLIYGILGSQGTGKTTLAKILILIIAKLGYNAITISLDDIYKTYAERQLLQKQDSRLIWRGPPGTHDISLGVEVLDKLRQSGDKLSGYLISIPRFNKSLFNGAGDRIKPDQVSNVDIILFEGWFVGVRPINDTIFDNPPLPIITEADRKFARDMNLKLTEYLPLWERLDRLMVLYPTDYRFSKQWRQQAEQEMISSGKSGMKDNEVEQFVEYFWKALHPELFIKPLIENPEFVDLVIEINADHSMEKISQPGG
ncbi:MAG: glycerate kinase [Microcoleaceae cyanobacterium MO_207.B10]|nr:glycerate kinase [Microcoleaceae cyanobacterium MO_207.B10]